MQEYKLHETYELEGVWKIPDIQEEFSGRLTLSPENIKLEIYSFGNSKIGLKIGEYDNNDPPIYGRSIDGTLITLACGFCCCRPSNFFSDSNEDGVIGLRSTIIANYCFIGSHIKDLETPVEANYYLGFPNLESWLNFHPYQNIDRKKKRKNLIKELYISEADKILNLYLPSVEARLHSFHSISLTFPSVKRFKSECKGYLVFESGHMISAISAVNFAYDVTRLWSLLIGSYIEPSDISFSKIKKEGETFKEEVNIHVYISSGQLRKQEEVHPGDILLNFETLKKNIEKITDKWFSLTEEDRAIRGLFFNSFKEQKKHNYSVEQFLSYVSILEIIGRNFKPSKILSKLEAKKLREALMRIVNENVKKKDVRKRIESRLLHYHLPTLIEDIEFISASLSPKIRKRFLVLENKQIIKIVKTRNYYTHYGDVREDEIYAREDLQGIIDQLGALIILLFLKNLGVNPLTIIKRFDKIQYFRNALKH